MRYMFLLLCAVCAAPAFAQSPYEIGRGWQLELTPYERGPAAALAPSSESYLSATGLYRLTDYVDVRAQLGYTDQDSYVYAKVGIGSIVALPAYANWFGRLDASYAAGVRSEGLSGARHVLEGRVTLFHALTASRDVQAFPGVYVATDADFLERTVILERIPIEGPPSEEDAVRERGGPYRLVFGTQRMRTNIFYGASLPTYIRVWRNVRVLVEPTLGFGSRSAHASDFTLRVGGHVVL
ncbi:MAG: hypothetical protein AAGJ10_06070 [Bacteroidota bacterium]